MDVNDPLEPAILARSIVRLGLVADTHVPDRASQLHPALIPGLDAAGVDVIIHLGDICERSVLGALRDVAPVVAVAGNRDWTYGNDLPEVARLEIHGRQFVFAHGHGGIWHYLSDKARHTLQGYQLGRYIAYFRQEYPGADVVAFGHTHVPENHLDGQQLIFNPGSASIAWRGDERPGFGVIEMTSGGEVRTSHLPLEGFTLHQKHWRALH